MRTTNGPINHNPRAPPTARIPVPVSVTANRSVFPAVALLCTILGSVQLGCGFLLFTFGSRHVPAVEVILLALTEVILAPIWVALFVKEIPGPSTFFGGVVRLAAIIVQALAGTPTSE